jgi:hypothetical protein
VTEGRDLQRKSPAHTSCKHHGTWGHRGRSRTPWSSASGMATSSTRLDRIHIRIHATAFEFCPYGFDPPPNGFDLPQILADL